MEDIQFTWRDLKRAVNKMPESRLDDQVTIWTEDGANTVENIMVLAENYVNDGDEAVVPISIMRQMISDDKRAGRYDPDDYDLTPLYLKGTRILEA